MMNKNDFSDKVKSAFADTRPSQELMSRITENTKRPRPVKHSLVKIAAAAAAVCLIGGAGVYAASEMNFINVFGDYIHVSDSELADSLMGTVHNFKYKVSDDAYAIRVIGITGDSKKMIFKAEIYRKDGTPVSDYFKNLPENDNMSLEMPEDHYILFANCGSGVGSEINSSGNIEIYYEMYSDETSLKGKKFYAGGSDFYPLKKAWDFCDDNDVFMTYDTFEKTNIIKTRSNEISDISDEDIIGLRLDWNFSFRYNPSEKSEMKKICRDTEKSFDMSSIILSVPDENGNVNNTETTFTCTPSIIEFTSVSGKMKYSFVSEECINSTTNSMKPVVLSSDDMYILCEDGSRIFLGFGAESITHSGDVFTVNTDIEYTDEKNGDDRIFTDVSEFRELHLNGTVYSLE